MKEIFQTLEDRGIKRTDFDLLVIADGAGQGYERHASWACVTFNRLSGAARVMNGAVSHGTVTRAEVEPFLHAMTLDLYQDNQGVLLQPRRLVCVTDSAAAVGMFNRCWGPESQSLTPDGDVLPDRPYFKANGDLVARMRHFRDSGYTVQMVHIRRTDLPAHRRMDDLSRSGVMLKEALKGVDPYVILGTNNTEPAVPAGG